LRSLPKSFHSFQHYLFITIECGCDYYGTASWQAASSDSIYANMESLTEGRSEDMAENVRSLEDLKGRTIDEVLREVAHHGQAITVMLEDGELIVIQPASQLKPLPELEGFVPIGWKDAVYDE
jgi:hypothetical protein